MKERPILFSGAMVRAILAGTKTQTRRVLLDDDLLETFEGRPHCLHGRRCESFCDYACGGAVFFDETRGVAIEHDKKPTNRTPFGGPGDRLWVRETYSPRDRHGAACSIGDARFAVLADGTQVYRDGVVITGLPKYAEGAADGIKWRPSIHMPRWASRISLEVTEVRVERLTEISEADAKAEGVEPNPKHSFCKPERRLTQAFASLWDSINGHRLPWASNPWVWVVAFRQV